MQKSIGRSKYVENYLTLALAEVKPTDPYYEFNGNSPNLLY